MAHPLSLATEPGAVVVVRPVEPGLLAEHAHWTGRDAGVSGVRPALPADRAGIAVTALGRGGGPDRAAALFQTGGFPLGLKRKGLRRGGRLQRDLEEVGPELAGEEQAAGAGLQRDA